MKAYPASRFARLILARAKVDGESVARTICARGRFALVVVYETRKARRHREQRVAPKGGTDA